AVAGKPTATAGAAAIEVAAKHYPFSSASPCFTGRCHFSYAIATTVLMKQVCGLVYLKAYPMCVLSHMHN
ncbi:MAG: hypothetical protein RR814_08010, partial [Oscillospiraceae bacterium]